MASSVADRVATWDGLDARGVRVCPGFYFARLDVDGRRVATRSVTLAAGPER